jgi:adenylate cyclase
MLGAYAIFTALRLALAWRGRLAAWFLALSVVVDIAVLMLTIWSFHLQYDQPAGLYLKAPTVLYLFVIVALRMLRFDARWVGLAGGAAGLGWLALLLYALRDAPVTHSYVEYMTSLKVLIGAEVDKIVAIAGVTAILALALIRARRLLFRAVADEAASMELSRFFAPDIADAIKSADRPIRPGEGMLREAAAMFIDLRGFTSLASRLAPAELVALLGEYQSRVARIVHEHGGSITTYLGDGVMVTFGATRDSPCFAADALAAADALLAALGAWQAERLAAGLAGPGVGIGVCSGTVLYGAIGGEGRLEYAIIGDPVNRAAKIQSHTKEAGVRALADAATVALAARQRPLDASRFRLIPASRVGGVAHPVDLAVLG